MYLIQGSFVKSLDFNSHHIKELIKFERDFSKTTQTICLARVFLKLLNQN